jgi:HAD superfamily hydrolase (TIGR01549 family)
MSSSPRWGQTTKLLVAATLLFLAGWVVYLFRSILAPLIIACLIAYIFSPLVGWLSRHLHIARGWSTLLLYVIALAALAAAPAFTVPAVGNQVIELWKDLDTIVEWVIKWLEQDREVYALGYVIAIPGLEIPSFEFNLEQAIGFLEGAISPIGRGAFSVIMTVATGVGWVVFVAMVAAYLMVDAERVGPTLLRVVPPRFRDEATKLGEQINRTWNKFLRGQLVLSVTVGLLTWVAMAAIGLPFALALGAMAGVLEVIPGFGPFLAAIPAVLIALFQGASYLPTSNLITAFIVIGIYILIQNIENKFLVPRIIGSSLKLHPLIVFVGVLAGATVAGILGALLAAPVLATVRDLLKYTYAKLADLDPFPEPPSFATKVKEHDVRAILFDLDGTLLDADDMMVERTAARIAPFELLRRLYDSKRLARQLVMAAEGPLNWTVTVLDAVGLDETFLAFEDWLERVYGHRAPDQYIAVEGVVRFVQQSSQVYDLAIATTRTRKDTTAFVERFGLDGCFKAVITREDVRRLKPHPEPILRAAEVLGHAPEQCIVVGDTTVDVRAGKGAGALTVAVLCGFGERPELARHNPDLILESPAELMRYLPCDDEDWRNDW